MGVEKVISANKVDHADVISLDVSDIIKIAKDLEQSRSITCYIL